MDRPLYRTRGTWVEVRRTISEKDDGCEIAGYQRDVSTQQVSRKIEEKEERTTPINLHLDGFRHNIYFPKHHLFPFFSLSAQAFDSQDLLQPKSLGPIQTLANPHAKDLPPVLQRRRLELSSNKGSIDQVLGPKSTGNDVVPKKFSKLF